MYNKVKNFVKLLCKVLQILRLGWIMYPKNLRVEV